MPAKIRQLIPDGLLMARWTKRHNLNSEREVIISPTLMYDALTLQVASHAGSV